MPDIPAGWYPDQNDPFRERLWDGERWLEHTRTRQPDQVGSGVASDTAVSGTARFPNDNDRVFSSRRIRSRLITIRWLLIGLYALLICAGVIVLTSGGSIDALTDEMLILVGLTYVAGLVVLIAVAGISAQTARMSGAHTLHPAVSSVGVVGGLVAGSVLFEIFAVPSSLEEAFAVNPSGGWSQSSVILYLSSSLCFSALLLASLVAPLFALCSHVKATAFDDLYLPAGSFVYFLFYGALAFTGLVVFPEFFGGVRSGLTFTYSAGKFFFIFPVMLIIGFDRILVQMAREIAEPADQDH